MQTALRSLMRVGALSLDGARVYGAGVLEGARDMVAAHVSPPAAYTLLQEAADARAERAIAALDGRMGVGPASDLLTASERVQLRAQGRRNAVEQLTRLFMLAALPAEGLEAFVAGVVDGVAGARRAQPRR